MGSKRVLEQNKSQLISQVKAVSLDISRVQRCLQKLWVDGFLNGGKKLIKDQKDGLVGKVTSS